MYRYFSASGRGLACRVRGFQLSYAARIAFFTASALLSAPRRHIVLNAPRAGSNALPAVLKEPGAFLRGEKDIGLLAGDALLHLLVNGAAAIEVAARKLCSA